MQGLVRSMNTELREWRALNEQAHGSTAAPPASPRAGQLCRAVGMLENSTKAAADQPAQQKNPNLHSTVPVRSPCETCCTRASTAGELPEVTEADGFALGAPSSKDSSESWRGLETQS